MKNQKVTYEIIDSDNETEIKLSDNIKIYVGVKYNDKEIAKSKNAKWDKGVGAWFFQYNKEEFKNNDTLNTNIFKPFMVISTPKIDAGMLYQTSVIRYNEFMKQHNT